MYLFERKAPDSTTMALTATLGVIVLAVAEAEQGPRRPPGLSVRCSGLVGHHRRERRGLVASLARRRWRGRRFRGPARWCRLLPSIAVTVASNVPAGAVGLRPPAC